MTNYINTEVLCEAYSKLNIDIYNDPPKLAALKKQLIAFFEERAKFSFGEGVRVEVEFEEGSLITKLRVVGGAVTVLAAAVTQYGSFRDGVTQIAGDATALAHSANYEVIFRTKTAYCNRIDAERRKGIFGRVDALIEALDAVNRGLSQDDIPRNSAALAQYNRSIDALLHWESTSDRFFARLSDEPTIACIAAGLLEELERLPEEPRWSAALPKGGLRVQIATSNSAKAGDLAGTVARMAEVVKSVKKAMLNRVNLVAPKRA